MSLAKILRSALLVLLVFTFLFSSGIPSITVNAAEASFLTKAVDSGRTPSLALDPGGSPKIAYCFLVDPSGTANTYQLRYAERADRYNPSAIWTWVTIETLPPNTVCSDTSLRIDSAGTVHIAYLTQLSSTYQIKHATRPSTSSTWTIQVLDTSTTSVYQTPSLALTPNGLPRIAYYDSTNKDLIYTYNDGGGWQKNSLFDTTGNVGQWPSLVISKSGIEHIVYSDRTNTPNFKHAWRDGTGWHFESFDPINDPSSGGTLVKAVVLDDESLHVAYMFSSPCGSNFCISIRYAKKVGQTWQDEEITNIANFSGSLSDLVIGVSQDEIPNVSYLYWNGTPYGNGVLSVWTKGTNVWAFQTLPQNNHMTSMGIDSKGNTHAVIYSCNYQYCNTQYAYKERSYPVSGKVLNRSGEGVQGVTVTAGMTTATTDVNGNFTFNLSKGTATLVPSKPGVGFIQKSHRIAIPGGLPGNIVFTTTDYGASAAPFLHFPIHYSSPDEAIRALYPSKLYPGGKINSWFDHRFPNNGTANGDPDNPMALPYHLTLTSNMQNFAQLLKAYGYSGHDGLDIKRNGSVNDTAVYPASDGTVVLTQTNKVPCYPTCKGDYGNYVVIDHSAYGAPGYYTLYAHLKDVFATDDTPVTTSSPIGTVGNTGYSDGAHLHFSVHRDDGTLDESGNTYWNGVGYDKPVDPYGWLPNANGRDNLADPYVAEKAGPPSGWLWVESVPLNVQVTGSDGAVVQDSSSKATLTFPVGFFTGIAEFEFHRAPGPIPADFWRSLGLTYRVELLNGLQNNPPVLDIQPQSIALMDEDSSAQFTISMEYDPTQLAHLDEDGLLIQRWDESSQAWSALPSAINPTARTVSAYSDRFGAYDLQAPLNCPADVLEGNDSADSASPFEPAVGMAIQYFDIPLDQDWYVFQASSSQTATMQAYDLSESVALQMTLYSEDLQALTSGAESITWSADENATYYLAVSSLEGGASGCSAVYSLRSASPHQVFLPLLRR